MHIIVLTPDSIINGMGGLAVQLQHMVEGLLNLDPNITFQIIGPPCNYVNDRVLYSTLPSVPFIGASNKDDVYKCLSNEMAYLAVEVEIKPDIIIAFDWGTSTAGLLMKQKYNVPLAWGCSLSYGCWIRDLCSFYKYQNTEKVVDYVVTKEQTAFVRADRVICNSNWFQSYFPPLRSVDIIPNGVDFDHIKQIKPLDRYLLKGTRKYNICYMSRLVANKGVQFLIDSDSIPDNCNLYFIGQQDGSSDEIYHDLMELTKKDERFISLGKITGDLRYSYIKAMDLVILPSIHEPFGIVSLEVQACGIAFMYSNIPGLGDISSGISLMIKDKTPAEMPRYICDKIREFLALGENDRETITEKGLDNVKKFDWEKINYVYYDLLKDCLEKK